MIVVIGASSFIGLYTVNALIENGYEVCATGRNKRFKEIYEQKNVKYIKLDLEDKEAYNKLPTENVEAVILLAAYLPANAGEDLVDCENADKYIMINTIGTINVLEYCRKNNIKRMIAASSYADMSGYFGTNTIITEDLPRKFSLQDDHAAYVISKNAANDMMEYYNQQHGMKNAIFRFPPVYGVGPHGYLKVNGKVVKSGLQVFIDKARSGEDIEIYGNKDVARDVVYVKDVANAFVKALQSDKTYGLYNIAAGVSVSLEKQVQSVIKVFGKGDIDIIYSPEKKNNSKTYYISIDKAKKDFGYEPLYADFEKMMIDWKNEEETKTDRKSTRLNSSH